MQSVWAVAIGGALGSVARFWASGYVARHFGEAFPWGTLIVNVVGSFVIGLFVALTGPDGRWLVAPTARQFFTLGLCGGFTTFSSFSLQTLTLIQEGEWLYASLNIVLSVVCCLAGVWLGYALGVNLSTPKGG